jgi:hypothetical protein
VNMTDELPQSHQPTPLALRSESPSNNGFLGSPQTG